MLRLQRLKFALRLTKWSFVLLILPALACNTLFPPRPTVEWNAAVNNVVIEASSGGGMLYDPNPMPFAQLRGDGRLIWVEGGDSGRRVKVANMTTDQVRQLLQTIVDDGFFGWKDSYSPGIVYDAPSTCLTVSLTSGSKSVCETVSGAPAKFHDLLSRLGSGAGATGADFVPERGYLKVTPLGSGPAAGGPSVVAWPSRQLGLKLADVGEGKWIDGEALRLAWSAVNANPLNPILQDGDTYYQAQVLVSGVTGMEPPN
jgi:hypothetical protein